jgi:hypothetical protein
MMAAEKPGLGGNTQGDRGTGWDARLHCPMRGSMCPLIPKLSPVSWDLKNKSTCELQMSFHECSIDALQRKLQKYGHEYFIEHWGLPEH